MSTVGTIWADTSLLPLAFSWHFFLFSGPSYSFANGAGRKQNFKMNLSPYLKVNDKKKLDKS